MESFFQICFELLAEKTTNIQTNIEVRILIKVQCFIYQWIHFHKLYELKESFFHILE